MFNTKQLVPRRTVLDHWTRQQAERFLLIFAFTLVWHCVQRDSVSNVRSMLGILQTGLYLTCPGRWDLLRKWFESQWHLSVVRDGRKFATRFTISWSLNWIFFSLESLNTCLLHSLGHKGDALSRKETPDLGVTKLHYLLSAVCGEMAGGPHPAWVSGKSH